MHPLRRVPERVPRLPQRERARVRRGLLGSDGQGAHAAAVGRGRGRRPAVRLDAVSRVQRRVPGEDPARRHDPRAAVRAVDRGNAGTPSPPAVLDAVGPNAVDAAQYRVTTALGRASAVASPACARGRRPAISHDRRVVPRTLGRSSGDRAFDRRTPGELVHRARSAEPRRRADRDRGARRDSSRATTTSGCPGSSTRSSATARRDDAGRPGMGAPPPDAAVGITGARLAVAEPAAIAVAAATGSPRATSLVPRRTSVCCGRRRRADARRRSRASPASCRARSRGSAARAVPAISR